MSDEQKGNTGSPASNPLMSVDEWVRRLEEAFHEGGVVGPHLLPVIDAEREHLDYVVRTFKGDILLTDCFLSFYRETLIRAETQWRLQSGGKGRFGPLLLVHASCFRRLRAAENLLLSGYPLSGYALLRDLKDQALILAAIASGITSCERVNGYADSTGQIRTINSREQLGEVIEHRKAEQARVLRLMIRKRSGLDDTNRQLLERWEGMFHQEVHGSHLSSALLAIEWVESATQPLRLQPKPDQVSVAMYANRSHEISWMILRTFPFLQFGAEFDSAWAGKWRVLDDSFLVMEQALERQDKPIATAVIYLLNKKFDFQPQSTVYVEREP